MKVSLGDKLLLIESSPVDWALHCSLSRFGQEVVMISQNQKYQHIQGVILLAFTTFIWGSSFAILKEVFASLSPAVLLAARFAIAALIFLPFARRLNARLLLDGALLGLILFSCYVTAAIGLETTAANRAGFIFLASGIALIGMLPLSKDSPRKT